MYFYKVMLTNGKQIDIVADAIASIRKYGKRYLMFYKHDETGDEVIAVAQIKAKYIVGWWIV